MFTFVVVVAPRESGLVTTVSTPVETKTGKSCLPLPARTARLPSAAAAMLNVSPFTPIGPLRLASNRLYPMPRVFPNTASVSAARRAANLLPPVRVEMLTMPACAFPYCALAAPVVTDTSSKPLLATWTPAFDTSRLPGFDERTVLP